MMLKKKKRAPLCSWGCTEGGDARPFHAHGGAAWGLCPYIDLTKAMGFVDAEGFLDVVVARCAGNPTLRAELLRGDNATRRDGAQYGFLMAHIGHASTLYSSGAQRTAALLAYVDAIARQPGVDLRRVDAYQRSGLLRIAQLRTTMADDDGDDDDAHDPGRPLLVFRRLVEAHGYAEADVRRAIAQERFLNTCPSSLSSPTTLQDEEGDDGGLHLMVAALFPHAAADEGASAKLRRATAGRRRAAVALARRCPDNGETLLHLAVRSCVYACFGRVCGSQYWSRRELQAVMALLVDEIGVDPLARNGRGQLVTAMLADAPINPYLAGSFKALDYARTIQASRVAACVHQLVEHNHARGVAVAMALHARLGRGSPLALLGADLIAAHVAPFVGRSV